MDPRTRAPDDAAPPAPAEPSDQRLIDERLDEELDETFPASDPIPFRHDP